LIALDVKGERRKVVVSGGKRLGFGFYERERRATLK